MNQSNINKDNLKHVLERIRNACDNCNRNVNEVQLIGASKTKPASLIRDFYQLGQHHFGENYLSEAINKQTELSDINITWHYIGQIQSNKTKLLANHFDWVHGVDRLKIAQRLNDQNLQNKKLNILIQINLDDESSKAGISIDKATHLAKEISQFKNLSLRGLMALPKKRNDPQEQQKTLEQLKTTIIEINTELNLSLDTISAGMSGDLEAAISAGSTMVRIGTDLFGARP
jgi:pyridoxal phosphate enzyme (YggS family)